MFCIMYFIVDLNAKSSADEFISEPDLKMNEKLSCVLSHYVTSGCVVYHFLCMILG